MNYSTLFLVSSLPQTARLPLRQADMMSYYSVEIWEILPCRYVILAHAASGH